MSTIVSYYHRIYITTTVFHYNTNPLVTKVYEKLYMFLSLLITDAGQSFEYDTETAWSAIFIRHSQW